MICSAPTRAAVLLAVMTAVFPAHAQPTFMLSKQGNLQPGSEVPGREHNYLNSGWVTAQGQGPGPRLVYSGLVELRGTMWLRLHFGLATLSGERGDDNASYLVLTSDADGASQTLWAEDLEAWDMSSAYFNGDRVWVDLYASPQSGPSRIQINGVECGQPGWLDRSICGPIDGRVPTGDPRAARLLPSQCTAWLVSDLTSGLLTAGHCSVVPRTVVQFNIPASTVGGSMVHPDPIHQYPVDHTSKQNGLGGVGNDWMFIGVYPNSNTGLTALASQGSTYHLADTMPPNDNRPLAVTGYGQVSMPTPLYYNYLQTTGIGQFRGSTATTLRHTVDTTGGNSGAPVIDLTTGLAIGIHTNGGCNSEGSNRGTAATRTTLRAALAAPIGAAAHTDGVRITYLQGRPAQVAPGGGTTMRVRIRPSDTRTPVPNTATLHVFDGTNWSQSPMERINDEIYRGTFPAVAGCASRLLYFVSVENTLGELNISPSGGGTFEAPIGHPSEILGAYNFEQLQGWNTSNGPGLRAGAWAINTPPSVGRLGPKADFDASGRCLLTGPSSNADVDGGRTTATSPSIATCVGSDVHISMAVWHAATTPGNEGMAIEVSTNNGNAWTEIDRVMQTDGWEMRVYRLSDYTPPRSNLRVRFVTSDTDTEAAPEGGIVESAVDRLEVFEPFCASASDNSGDAAFNEADIARYLRTWSAGDPAADRTGDGHVEIDDLMSLLQGLQGGCP